MHSFDGSCTFSTMAAQRVDGDASDGSEGSGGRAPTAVMADCSSDVWSSVSSDEVPDRNVLLWSRFASRLLGMSYHDSSVCSEEFPALISRHELALRRWRRFVSALLSV